MKNCRYLLAQLVLLSILTPVLSLAEPVSEARDAYEHGKFDDALKLLDPLIVDGAGPPGALELWLRIYLKTLKADKAILDYNRLMEHRSKEDPALLRELCVGVVGASLHDMREQVRGAAVTALKEMGGRDTVSMLEEAMADPSGLVRALAVAGDSYAYQRSFRSAEYRSRYGCGVLADRRESKTSTAIAGLLKDPVPLVRGAAAMGLTKLEGAAAAEAVEPLLRDTVEVVRAAAAADRCNPSYRAPRD